MNDLLIILMVVLPFYIILGVVAMTQDMIDDRRILTKQILLERFFVVTFWPLVFIYRASKWWAELPDEEEKTEQ